jgi:hypothetical protein
MSESSETPWEKTRAAGDGWVDAMRNAWWSGEEEVDGSIAGPVAACKSETVVSLTSSSSAKPYAWLRLEILLFRTIAHRSVLISTNYQPFILPRPCDLSSKHSPRCTQLIYG